MDFSRSASEDDRFRSEEDIYLSMFRYSEGLQAGILFGGPDFSRLRIGIGRNSLFDTKDYVLSRPSGSERDLIDESIKLSVDAVMCWVCDGIERAMTRYNVKNKT